MDETPQIETTRKLAEVVDSTGIRQGEIAALVGVTQPTISIWLNGGTPTRRNERKLIQALETLSATPTHPKNTRRDRTTK